MKQFFIKGVGEVLARTQEAIEQTQRNHVRVAPFFAFMAYGLGAIFLLKISQLVLDWSF